MLKYLIIQLSDSSPSFCHYESKVSSDKLLPIDNLKDAIKLSMKENLSIQMLFPEYELPAEYQNVLSNFWVIRIASCNSFYASQSDVIVFNSIPEYNEYDFDSNRICIILLNLKEIHSLRNLDEQKLLSTKRLAISLQGIEFISDKDYEEYKIELALLSSKLERLYEKSSKVTVNILTDLIFSDSMNNCNAGIESITVAPNGKMYLCPAFYYDNPESHIGDCDSGVAINNRYLLELGAAPICRICDAFHCRRCVWLNEKLTGELNTPSKQQCVISHIERNQSKELLSHLRELDPFFARGRSIRDISYLDPFELISR